MHQHDKSEAYVRHYIVKPIYKKFGYLLSLPIIIQKDPRIIITLHLILHSGISRNMFIDWGRGREAHKGNSMHAMCPSRSVFLSMYFIQKWRKTKNFGYDHVNASDTRKTPLINIWNKWINVIYRKGHITRYHPQTQCNSKLQSILPLKLQIIG